jgi:hypothetical protein
MNDAVFVLGKISIIYQVVEYVSVLDFAETDQCRRFPSSGGGDDLIYRLYLLAVPGGIPPHHTIRSKVIILFK